MSNIYKKIELVGTSPNSYQEAIENAITKAAKSIRGLSWYEVTEHRGHITDGKVSEFQVILKASFKLDD
jgi:hypothetical protein